MMVAWIVGTFVLLGVGSAVQDRWPGSITARLCALAGGAWFAGVWLALLLLQ